MSFYTFISLSPSLSLSFFILSLYHFIIFYSSAIREGADSHKDRQWATLRLTFITYPLIVEGRCDSFEVLISTHSHANRVD